MTLRIVRRVRVNSIWVEVPRIQALGQLYPYSEFRLRGVVLRHFDASRGLIQIVNEEFDGAYRFSDIDHLQMTSDIARRFAILTDHWLEVVVSHARSLIHSEKGEEEVFPGRQVADLEFDPDGTDNPSAEVSDA